MSEQKRGIIGFVVNNKGLKLLALLLALITWYGIQQTINFETVLTDVPLKLQIDEGWAVLAMSSDTVDIHFRGSQEDLVKLRREYLEVEVDLRGLEGASTIDLKPSLVKAPAGVRVAYLRPATLDISVDREGQKQVPVKADVPVHDPEGFKIEKVVCVPASVLVSGPRQRLAEIDSVRTEVVTLTGRNGSFRERVGIVSPSKTWLASVEPEKVSVEVTLLESSDKKIFEDVEVRALIPAGRTLDVHMKPSKVSIELIGRTEMLEGLTLGDLVAYVDCSDLVAAKYDLPVRVTTPAGMSLVGVEPASISVQVSLK